MSDTRTCHRCEKVGSVDTFELLSLMKFRLVNIRSIALFRSATLPVTAPRCPRVGMADAVQEEDGFSRAVVSLAREYLKLYWFAFYTNLLL